MQRYFVPSEQFSESSVRIAGDDAYHLAKVMRARPGEGVIVSDGRGRVVRAELERIGVDEVSARIVESIRSMQEPKVQVTIAQGLPKADKMEYVIQKCTEIGAVRFVPFHSARTIVQYDAKKTAKRIERWAKIAKEAAEQAHRDRVPDVSTPCSWAKLMGLIADYDAAFFCYERASTVPFREALQAIWSGWDWHDDSRSRVLLIVGPEGGFTEEEAAEAEQSGAAPVGLGARILRTETAAMVGLSCILYETGEMGGG